MKFNQRVISAIKPGIRLGKREIKSMLKSNSINYIKFVDTYALSGGEDVNPTNISMITNGGWGSTKVRTGTWSVKYCTRLISLNSVTQRT